MTLGALYDRLGEPTNSPADQQSEVAGNRP